VMCFAGSLHRNHSPRFGFRSHMPERCLSVAWVGSAVQSCGRSVTALPFNPFFMHCAHEEI
jgi:hypothetical protein